MVGVLAQRDNQGSVVAEEVLRHEADRNEDEATQLRAIADHIESRLRDIAPDVVVVRSLDWFGRINRDTARKRYLAEGAITTEVRRHLDAVEALPGRDIGTRCGSSKNEVEEDAKALVGEDAKEAGGAALAALKTAES